MATKTPDALSKDGFRIGDREGKLDDFSLLALREGLRAYFETHRSLGVATELDGDDVDQAALPQDEEERWHYLQGHSYEYCASFASTIINLQQFTELRVKRCLAARHVLLVAEPTKSAVLLDRLLQGGVSPSAEEERDLRFVEAAEALARLRELALVLTDDTSKTLLRYESLIKTLNGLRNRVLHRGVWVLRYTALDILVCEHFFGLLAGLRAADPAYDQLDDVWRYKPISAGFDPIEMLHAHYTAGGTRSVAKSLFLKEFAYAAYRNPVVEFRGNVVNQHEVRILEALAHERGDPQKCPVCARATLVVEEAAVDPSDPDCDLSYPYRAECVCCGLSLCHRWGNASSHGIQGVPDYFGAIADAGER